MKEDDDVKSVTRQFCDWVTSLVVCVVSVWSVSMCGLCVVWCDVTCVVWCVTEGG